MRQGLSTSFAGAALHRSAASEVGSSIGGSACIEQANLPSKTAIKEIHGYVHASPMNQQISLFDALNYRRV